MDEYNPIDDSSRTIQVIGIGRRFMAFFIDSFFLYLVGVIIIMAFDFMLRRFFQNGINFNYILELNIYITFSLAFIYDVAFWMTTGQTLGKKLLGIKVIAINGGPLSFRQALIRWLGYILSALVIGLGFASISFDKKRQAWHDTISKSYVVKQDERFSRTEPVTFVAAADDSGEIFVWIFYLMFFVVPLLMIILLTITGPQSSAPF